ncbi:hypothetical protein GCM10022286_16670 [Gryllotalpicola daejeonensis]|uniref:GNAT family N-acetyltransferase n=1 Tax=Gryllotalpicola daejeonensis TaxID=993087 RepID=A0ABP7ZJQ0_9MICO
MSELVVRTATLEDAAGMARVHVRSWQETYRGLESDEVLDAPDFGASEPFGSGREIRTVRP